MIDATLNLTRLHCNAESDFGGAEPYLWTVFFYSDFSTISGSGGLVATHTPHQTSTTRGMYANGIDAGDDVAVPTSMGEFDVTLDGGGFGLSLLGCLFVLIDERNTDADAIKAGHVAFGALAHQALNELAATKIGALDMRPTPEEVKAMSDFIAAGVEAAIRNQLSFWDVLDQQDRYVGSGFKVYSDAEIGELVDDSGVDELVVNIRAQRTFSTWPSGPTDHPAGTPGTTTLIDDYDLHGTLRVRQAEEIPRPSDPEQRDFARAVDVLKRVQATVAGLEDDVSRATGDAKLRLLDELRHARKVTLTTALAAVRDARRAYDAKRGVPGQGGCGCGCGGAGAVAQRCVNGDCCDEYRSRMIQNCMATTNFGIDYCTDYGNYRFQLCRNPDARTPPTPPAALR